jgi:hypothetical protein
MCTSIAEIMFARQESMSLSSPIFIGITSSKFIFAGMKESVPLNFIRAILNKVRRHERSRPHNQGPRKCILTLLEQYNTEACDMYLTHMCSSAGM